MLHERRIMLVERRKDSVAVLSFCSALVYLVGKDI